jgi:hypothetical protein
MIFGADRSAVLLVTASRGMDATRLASRPFRHRPGFKLSGGAGRDFRVTLFRRVAHLVFQPAACAVRILKLR